MARDKRLQDPDWIFYVTNRTKGGMPLLGPDDKLNAVVMLWLRAAVRIYGVELYAAVILEDEFHLVLRAPQNNLHRFMGYFTGNLSKALIKSHDGLEAPVFPKRYHAEPILDVPAFEQTLVETVMRPVAADLAESPDQYAGYSSWHQNVGEELPERFEEAPPLITPPPMWSTLAPAQRAEKWRDLVNRAIAARMDSSPPCGDGRSKGGAGRPSCRTSCPIIEARYVGCRKQVERRYTRATAALRRDEVARFPRGTIPHGWNKCEHRGRRMLPPDLRIYALARAVGGERAG